MREEGTGAVDEGGGEERGGGGGKRQTGEHDGWSRGTPPAPPVYNNPTLWACGQALVDVTQVGHPSRLTPGCQQSWGPRASPRVTTAALSHVPRQPGSMRLSGNATATSWFGVSSAVTRSPFVFRVFVDWDGTSLEGLVVR